MDLPAPVISALHNLNRTAWRRQKRWDRRVPMRFADEDGPPGAGLVSWELATAPESESPDRLAIRREFEEQNRELIERYRDTPVGDKQRRRELRSQIAHALLRAGLIGRRRYQELCGLGTVQCRMAPKSKMGRHQVVTSNALQHETAQGGPNQ